VVLSSLPASLRPYPNPNPNPAPAHVHVPCLCLLQIQLHFNMCNSHAKEVGAGLVRMGLAGMPWLPPLVLQF